MTTSFWKKALTLVGAITLAVPLALGMNGQKVSAADPATPGTQNVTVNKYAFKDAALEPKGDAEWDNSKAPENGKPLAGAKFTAYNITKQYWAYLKANPIARDADDKDDAKYKRALSEAIYQAVNPTKDQSADKTINFKDGTPVVEEDGKTPLELTTNDSGAATFTDLPQYTEVVTDADKGTSVKMPSVFVFVESGTPEGYQTAANTVVALPYGNGTEDVNIYPKNHFDTTKQYSLLFKKIDGNSKVALSGAKFKIKRTDTDGNVSFAHVDNPDEMTTSQDVTWVKEDDTTNEPSEFTSNGEGLFGFTSTAEAFFDGAYHGLKPGVNYSVVETVAPDGYKKDPKLVDATGAEIESADASEVVTGKDQNYTRVADTPTSILPHTGGAGIVLYVVLGAALVILGTIAYKKRRAN
ncbi:pilin N-terminal domain-containing protein [Lacticaseibacillus jixianensis]|uniref:Pilin N-terminal domain-containing protein n=1 Tax=Lacticaseibacillus jixianensis TaxID=2486012 RepID=A0ABW4BD76_9LACO|nr:pilin N-terminal domain-containing protein [Lacticaseibacillus jixianensis]